MPLRQRNRNLRRLAWLSVCASGTLAVLNVAVGVWTHSTSIVAAGVEFFSDVGASAVVLAGILLASRPADDDHPYGHGRFEILAGLAVGLILALAGGAICYRSLDRVGEIHPPPGPVGVTVLVFSIVVKSGLSTVKFRAGRRAGSASMVADAWNDFVDVVSGFAALIAVALFNHNPERFFSADHYGGFAVGVIVVITGLRIIRDACFDLADTMPDRGRLREVRAVALTVPGAIGVEKCFARKTGMQYHVDLHLEVDPDLTVRASHEIAQRVRDELRRSLPWVADVLVHVEPHGLE